eukprot:CAMPEP_0205906312 /NCGR_PEP_ID=MMETSP1325-20131115/1879_1 /ASSEMBLY_ACC=CAM_ASM_000708 /TAXON_ID=236786 /ORGANISM="Florenciella sp., Strain RCC1007" /LENGTH=56 /DNA_ID=CAMNT_0053272315 /DNA_START=148 /DNA_END=314 /DNA_ORIENTATION=+
MGGMTAVVSIEVNSGTNLLFDTSWSFHGQEVARAFDDDDDDDDHFRVTGPTKLHQR